MSLIVARKWESQICIVSDTKLTYPDHETRRLKTNPSEGIIKTLIIRPNVSVSFAGDVDEAELAIHEVQGHHSIETIIEILKRYHHNSNHKTEFLLCHDEPVPTIYKFKNGEYGSVQTAWIGDAKAFNCFQETMMGVTKKEKKNPKKPGGVRSLPATSKPIIEIEEMNLNMEVQVPQYFGKMSSAMDKVISDGNIDSVGGFKVNVIYKEKFYYNVYTKSYRGNFVMIGEGSHVIGHGEAYEGAYSINFFGGSPDFNTVALHIRQAKLGIAYHRKNGGLLRPHLHCMDEVDFYDLAIERYNLHAMFTTQDRAHKFIIEGKLAFSDRDFKKAAKLFDKAVVSAKDKQKAEALFFKGVTLLNLRDHATAMQTFQESINIDPSIHRRVSQLFTDGPKSG